MIHTCIFILMILMKGEVAEVNHFAPFAMGIDSFKFINGLTLVSVIFLFQAYDIGLE